MSDRRPIARPPSVKPRAGTRRALPRVLCIVGPTSSGKTDLGIQLAKRFDGEIINADARQVYRDFDIGTGKPVGVVKRVEGRRTFLVEEVPHYLMDFLTPDKTFTVADWREKAMTAVRGITGRKRLPVIVGGTGLYIQTLIDNYKIPSVPPQPTYRQAMEAKPLEELVRILLKMDPGSDKVVDLKNKRRVLRALEVTTFTGKPFSQQRSKAEPIVRPLLLAVHRDKAELHERINVAIERMIEAGWIDEIRRLHAQGTAWDAPAMTSIGYKELACYVRGECTLEVAIENVKRATRQYAKRQMTWFKRDPRIHWVRSVDEADELVRKWTRIKKSKKQDARDKKQKEETSSN